MYLIVFKRLIVQEETPVFDFKRMEFENKNELFDIVKETKK